MTNTVHHAYLKECKNEKERDVAFEQEAWWMFSYENKKEIFLVFCDLGYGIPNTLPIKCPELYKSLIEENDTLLDKVARKMQTIFCSDTKIITAVAQGSRGLRTRTRALNRGKGIIRDICGFIEKISGTGRVTILSNKGEYTLWKTKEGRATSTRENSQSINGTIIAIQARRPKGGFQE
jgi:hypothetical protein